MGLSAGPRSETVFLAHGREVDPGEVAVRFVVTMMDVGVGTVSTYA